MINYLNLMAEVLDYGVDVPDRTGTGTREVFGTTLDVPLYKNKFPLLTTRRIFYSGVLAELCCFIQGKFMLKDFKEAGCNYWDANAKAWPPNIVHPNQPLQLGRTYGVQWRNWDYHFDQLAALVGGLQADPHGRRHILTAWNPSELHLMCLPPCHIMSQFNVQNDKLNCFVYQRSVDVCLGLPSDIVLYAGLVHLLANHLGLDVGTLKFAFGSTHIYNNHLEQAEEQLLRTPGVEPDFELVEPDLFKPTVNMFRIRNYEPQEGIKYAFNV